MSEKFSQNNIYAAVTTLSIAPYILRVCVITTRPRHIY